jgi:flagellar basal body rod protein FlgG
MDSAASALRYWERKQEIIANNMANSTTDGFKAQRVFAQMLDGVTPSAATSSDLSAGSLRPTGNALDVALDGPGFFVASTPNGERYTRGGSLRLDDTHQLVDADGNALLGAKGPITLKGASKVEIDRSGTVTADGKVVDQLRVETAPKGVELQREGDSLWMPPSASARAVEAPAARQVKQGFIEESNVNTTGALVDMVAVQRAYASVQKAIVTIDAANETATTELAKPL